MSGRPLYPGPFVRSQQSQRRSRSDTADSSYGPISVLAEPVTCDHDADTESISKPSKVRRVTVSRREDGTTRRNRLLKAWIILLAAGSLWSGFYTRIKELPIIDQEEQLRLTLFEKRTATVAARLGPVLKNSSWLRDSKSTEVTV